MPSSCKSVDEVVSALRRATQWKRENIAACLLVVDFW